MFWILFLIGLAVAGAFAWPYQFDLSPGYALGWMLRALIAVIGFLCWLVILLLIC